VISKGKRIKFVSPLFGKDEFETELLRRKQHRKYFFRLDLPRVTGSARRYCMILARLFQK
jgi:hypothetical protein